MTKGMSWTPEKEQEFEAMRAHASRWVCTFRDFDDAYVYAWAKTLVLEPEAFGRWSCYLQDVV